jgi:hypothetical protein
MSNTRRRDPLDVSPYKPTPKEVCEARMDGKPSHKPGRAAKEYLSKGRKAKVRRALGAVIEDPDNTPMPREVKNHVWLYN